MTSHKLKVAVLLLALVFWPATRIFAETYTFKTYEGLGNLNITALTQDREGYLWVGTQGGIYRYDGRYFQQFGLPEGLQSTFVRSLLEDRNGSLWVGTADGLYLLRHDGSLSPVFFEGNRIIVDSLSALVNTADGRVGIFTQAGLLVAQGHFPAEPIHAELLAKSPIEGVKGELLRGGIPLGTSQRLMGCGSGLCRADFSKPHPFQPIPKVPQGTWDGFLPDAKTGQIWSLSDSAIA